MNLLTRMLKNRIANNAAWLIGAKIVQSGLSFVINLLTARYLGPTNYGVINYAASLASFVLPLMQLGINSIMVQELLQNRKQEGIILGTAVGMNLISAMICSLGIIAYSSAANPNEPVTVLVCGLYCSLLVFQAAENIVYWFQAHLLSKYTAITSVFAYLVISAYKVFLLASGKSVVWFAVSNSLDVAVYVAFLFAIYFRQGGQGLRFSKKVAVRLFQRGKYYIVSSMMVAIFAQTDRIMLKSMLGSQAVGYYSSAVSCAMLTSFVFSAIIDSFRPTILGSKHNSEADYRDRLRLLYAIIIYLSLAQSLGMTLLAKWVIRIAYGAQYSASIPVLQVVVWFTTFSYLGSVRNIWILAEEKQRYLWMINLSGALANVALNLVLIPKWGIIGAAAASLLTQFFTNVVVGWLIPAIRPNNRYMMAALNLKAVLASVRQIEEPESKISGENET